MSGTEGNPLPYKRNRFSTRLPANYLYTRSHFWLFETQLNQWRVGFTKFATRMLGDIVEFEFEAKMGLEINVADVIGWIEGFKAVSDLYSVAWGEFSGSNSIAINNPEIIGSDPYGDGWLYSINGKPDPMAVDVQGYIGHLDLTIDKMLEKPWQTPEIGST